MGDMSDERSETCRHCGTAIRWATQPTTIRRGSTSTVGGSVHRHLRRAQSRCRKGDAMRDDHDPLLLPFIIAVFVGLVVGSALGFGLPELAAHVCDMAREASDV